MKKCLLPLATLAMTALPSVAQVESDVVDGLLVAKISSNGTYGVTDEGDGSSFLINLETMEETELVTDGWISVGTGNAVSNTGIAVANTDEDLNEASYWENDEWHLLPLRSTDTGINYAQGITADGWRICGQVGRTSWGGDDALYQTPVYWERNGQGTYDDYVELPYPEFDFTGRVPQYVTALYISDDGKTIAGQVVDWTGRYILPIIYQESGDGEWTYTLLYDYNPEGVELPEPPGDAPSYVSILEYMTDDEVAAYERACKVYYEYVVAEPQLVDYATDEEYEAYYDAWYSSIDGQVYLDGYMSEENLAAYQLAHDIWEAEAVDYPTLFDFVSEDSYAEYEEAYNAYDSQYTEWLVKLMEYDEVFTELVSGKPTFGFNDVVLSCNGVYYGSVNCSYNEDYESVYIPWVFDINTGESVEHTEQTNMILCSISNDGMLLAGTPYMDYARWAWIAETIDGPFVALEDYMAKKDSALYEWMDQEMRHDYAYEEGYYDDDYNWIYKEIDVANGWLTGTPHGNEDFSVIACFEYNIWNSYAADYTSYILVSSDRAGIDDAMAVAEMSIKVTKDGCIIFSSAPASVAIYDLQGRLVLSASNPGTSLSAPLAAGIYIIRADNQTQKVKL